MSEEISIALKRGLKSRFVDQRTPAQLREIKIEGSPSIYFWPRASIRELIAMEEGARHGSNWEGALATVLARARDDQGRPLFSERERDDLLDRYEPEEIARIAVEMVTERVSAEEAEKN